MPRFYVGPRLRPGGRGCRARRRPRRPLRGAGPLSALRPFPGAAPRNPLGAPPPDPRASNAGEAGFSSPRDV
ncbi:hypothetical protein D1J60_18465 [Streptomyces sp. W1SF4]|nr:hypothetical protein D1J60_18465 [Streptomyces sp. W1SF4]